jgi:hypothetical protein
VARRLALAISTVAPKLHRIRNRRTNFPSYENVGYDGHVESSPPGSAAIAGVVLEVGRKIRSNALKSLISRKEDKPWAAAFGRCWHAFSGWEAGFASKTVRFSAQKRKR